MSVSVRRVCLLLALTLLLSLLAVAPGSPATPRPSIPETRSATVDGLPALTRQDDAAGGADAFASTADEDGAVQSATIEAPIPFVSLGISGAGKEPELQVRTRDLDGQWSEWSEAELREAAHAPDAGTAEAARASEGQPDWATSLVWAGPSDRVELEVVGADPEELEITFIDTSGLSESIVQRIGRWARSLTGGGQPVEASESGLRPDIQTRGDWGADESLRSGTPTEREVKFGVLHHTATSNDYGPEQGDDIVRSIYHYHTQSNGWNDIGYNFLVDKYGTIYEGRYGGMDKGIQGAHVAGWNSGSFGVSVIGHFNDYNPPTAAIDALIDIFSWKYAVHGLDPDPEATVSHNGYEIRTQESHRNLRDGYVKGSNDESFQQDCPGKWLYWQTPNLRAGIEERLDNAFSDVGNEHPFHTDIVWAAATDVTTGYPDGSFGPARDVSRQAMAAFAHRRAGQPDASGAPDPGFTDVGPNHPFYDEIRWAASKGIVSGYPDGTFRPDWPVARQAAAAFLHRYAGEPDPGTGGAQFSDVDEDHPFHDAITWAASVGITDGYPDGTFRPAEAVARQAATAFLHRLDDDAGAWLRVASVDATAASDTVTSEQDNTVIATVVDRDGDPVDGVTVEFAGGRGSLSAAERETDPGGRAATTYSPASADEGTQVTITADAEGQASDTATFAVEEPVELSVTADADKDVVTVGEDNTITATVVDQHGDPVEGVTVGFSGGSGDYSTTSATTDPDGVVTTTYTASSDDEGNEVAVTADARGEASDTATFTVEPEPSESETETA